MSLLGVITATGAAIADDPDEANALFRAAGSGGDGVRTHIRVGRHPVLVDETPALGGSDDAPNPVENALVALLSCQVVTHRFGAVQLGIPLDDVELEVEGDLDVRGYFGLPAVRPDVGEVRVAVRHTRPRGARALPGAAGGGRRAPARARPVRQRHAGDDPARHTPIRPRRHVAGWRA